MPNAPSSQCGILPPTRRAGACIHITSLPGTFGVGEIGDAAFAFIDALVQMNLRVWQILPIGPTGYGDSPYQALSSFAGNELLVDVAGLIRNGLLASNEADSLIHLSPNQVDFGALIGRKMALLDRAAGRFSAQVSAETQADFEQFKHEHDPIWLHDYALFRLLKSRHQERPWLRWAPEFAYRRQRALQKLGSRSQNEIEKIKIIQFLFHRQWTQLRAFAHNRGVEILGDMPFYVALDSADAWANGELLEIDRNGKATYVAGVPPDYFSEEGQLWGNPLYDWERHRADNFRWWVDRVRHTTALVDYLRIDHFRALESYWSIPGDAKSARDGKWKPGPGSALLDAFIDELGSLPLVAEDLGVITPAVEALRAQYGIPGMKVLQFEVSEPDFCIDDVVENCIVYTGTHDNDTTQGWFAGGAEKHCSKSDHKRTRNSLLQLTGGQAETIHNDLIRLMFSSSALLAIAPMQDYLGLGSEARMNSPGTVSNNWRWRIQREQLSPAVMTAIGTMVDEFGRAD